jgi:hypothetical protein
MPKPFVNRMALATEPADEVHAASFVPLQGEM